MLLAISIVVLVVVVTVFASKKKTKQQPTPSTTPYVPVESVPEPVSDPAPIVPSEEVIAVVEKVAKPAKKKPIRKSKAQAEK